MAISWKGLNIYSTIICEEAFKRGIGIRVVAPEQNIFELEYRSRKIRCRESLSDLTSSISLSICDDKFLTKTIVSAAGIATAKDYSFLDRSVIDSLLREGNELVVKPSRSEQGRGVTVGVRDLAAFDEAVGFAQRFPGSVLVEERVRGEDVRIIVIDDRVVAASIRKPPNVVGDGASSVKALIDGRNRLRMSQTGGESRTPFDAETSRFLRLQGVDYETCLEAGRAIQLRGTANLHMGGTITDVTGKLDKKLKDVAIEVAKVIGIKVVGVDLIVVSHTAGDYVFIEANERPGLANHEPQPTAERFVDLLFPETIAQSR